MDAAPAQHPPQAHSNNNIQNLNENEANVLVNKIQIIVDIRVENMDIVLSAIVSICNKEMNFLIDSGAHASMIKSKYIRSNVLYYPQIKYNMVGINGPTNAIQTHGATFGNITINNIKLKQQFQIAGDNIHLNYDGVLGMDFLHTYRTITDLENMKLTLLLPISHNMYEYGERQMFERANSHIKKAVIKNKLVYYSTPAIADNKKIAKMDILINRLEILKIETLSPQNRDKQIATISKNSMYDVENKIRENYNIFRILKIDEFEKISYGNRNDSRKRNIPERVNEILHKIDVSHCNDEEKKEILNLILEYNDVFHLADDGLTFAKEGEHRIFVKPGTNPVNTKQYRIPHAQKALVQEKIADMLKNKIIEPSTSIWNSPILLVPKKSTDHEKEYRFCVDYKNVNKNTELQTFPMPNLEEELCKMHGSNFFSALDIASAFHQIKMHDADKEKTAFTVNNQKYQFDRMPFGLAGSPITWQLYITKLLGDILNNNAMAYMDDILAYNRTLSEHVKLLRDIFDRLRHSGLKLNISKTKLLCRSITYLGHTIDKNGVRPNGNNIEAIRDFPMPKNEKQVKRFLGMASYFRKFIHQFAKIAHPLHQLSKKDAKFEWSEACNEAFKRLKIALTTAPVLAFADFSRKFYISVDASNYAVGAYISNEPPPNDKPIEYFSKSLSGAQINYSTTHKELLAIIMAIERFQHFIWGKPFVLYTDHQALTYLFSQSKPGSRLLRWKLALSEYNFQIIHRKGTNNVVSDCLSRIEPNASIQISHPIKNPTIKALINVMTRSRARESEIIAQKETCIKHVTEERSVSLDTKKFDRIVFVIDNSNCLAFKKLQAHMRKKMNLHELIPYKIYALDSAFHLITIPKINFNNEIMTDAIVEICQTCQNNCVERIAVNCGITNFHTYWQIKHSFREIFGKTEISFTLFMGTQVEISDVNDMNEILRVYHRSILGGHRGFERMKNTIQKFYTWPTMTADIKKYIESCEVCEKTKIHKHTHTPLQITSVASAPFEKIYVDFVGEIHPNSSEGHKYIMSISCDLTKYVVMLPTFDSTALTAAKIIVENVCLVFNIPKIIISDNGPAFVAETFKQMAKLLDIKHIKTTPYHPQSNGGIERYHRTLGQYIRSYVQKSPMTWNKYLQYFAFSHNIAIHSTTGYAPHSLVFGFDIEIPVSIKRSRHNYDYGSYHNELLTQLKEAHSRAKELIQKRKLENKKYYDKKNGQSNLELKRNDLVLVLNDVRKSKFDNKYSGPFRVEEIVSPAVTKIKKNKKSVVVHNDKIKKSKANHGSDTPPPLPERPIVQSTDDAN